MDPLTGSLLFAGGSSLLGALGNWFNANENRKAQKSANKANYEAQKEFYQNSVGWRVADSKRSGVNPIYGLGADSSSFSPSFQAAGNSGIGDALNSVSQAGLAMSQIIAQSDMMKAQTNMYNAEAKYKEAQIKQLEKPKVSATPSAPSFNKLTMKDLSKLPMDRMTPVQGTPWSIQPMDSSGKSFAMTTQNKDIAQAWMDGRTEQSGLLSAFAEMGLNISGARIYKDRIVFEDGSVYKLSEFKQLGFPTLLFSYSEKATKKELARRRAPIERKAVSDANQRREDSGYVGGVHYGYGGI